MSDYAFFEYQAKLTNTGHAEDGGEPVHCMIRMKNVDRDGKRLHCSFRTGKQTHCCGTLPKDSFRMSCAVAQFTCRPDRSTVVTRFPSDRPARHALPDECRGRVPGRRLE